MPSSRRYEAKCEKMLPRATPEEISRNFNHYPVVDLEVARMINHDGPIQTWRSNKLGWHLNFARDKMPNG